MLAPTLPAFVSPALTPAASAFSGPPPALQPPAPSSSSSLLFSSASFVATAPLPVPMLPVVSNAAAGLLSASSSRPLGNGAAPKSVDANHTEFSEKVAQLNKRCVAFEYEYEYPRTSSLTCWLLFVVDDSSAQDMSGSRVLLCAGFWSTSRRTSRRIRGAT